MTQPTSSSASSRTRAVVIVASLMLFSMFFGAGNLIFPPMLGVSAGTAFTPAIIGFLLAGVALPVLSVVAVAITGDDVYDLAQRGGKFFGLMFPVLVYLAVGAFYALPRTAVVSFSTAVTPLTGLHGVVPNAIFSVIFFIATLALAFDPTGLVDKLGKYLTPVLLVLLALLVALAVIKLPGHPSAPAADFADHPLTAGLIQGYMTMDSLGALAFGIIIVSSLRFKGISSGPTLVRSVAWAAIGAGVLLGLIYIGLGWVGQIIPNASSFAEGATLLAAAAKDTMGTPGMIVFGAIVLLACLSTSSGLIGATCEFFHRIVPAVSYRAWAVIFAVFSVALSSFGLEAVLAVAGPIIGFLYPAAITLVTLTLVEPLAHRKLHYTFRLALFVAVVWAALMSLDSVGFGSSVIEPLIGWAPMHSQQLGWVVPTVALAVVGFVLDLMLRPARAVPVGGEHQLNAELRGGHRDREALTEAVVDNSSTSSSSRSADTAETLRQHIASLTAERQEALARVETLDEALELAKQRHQEITGEKGTGEQA